MLPGQQVEQLCEVGKLEDSEKLPLQQQLEPY